jgi:hypothetical protein
MTSRLRCVTALMGGTRVMSDWSTRAAEAMGEPTEEEQTESRVDYLESLRWTLPGCGTCHRPFR